MDDNADEYGGYCFPDEVSQDLRIGGKMYRITFPPKTPQFVLAGMRLVLLEPTVEAEFDNGDVCGA